MHIICSISTKFDPSSSTFFSLDSFLDDFEIFLGLTAHIVRVKSV